MPRTGRGGRREGTQGKSYANRTDLNQPKQAITPISGGAYGDRKASVELQKVAPLAGAQDLPAAPPAPGPVIPAPPAITPFTAPTERPNEPMTAGLSMGPGVGPEALGLPNPNGGDYSQLAPYLPTLELLASRPGSSQDARNFVRALRANLPVGA